MSEKTLFLVLKKKWFDMIASGEKKEEYRGITAYWLKRLVHETDKWEPWTTITFQLGYKKDAPRIICEYKGLTVGGGKQEWGGSIKQTFVISIGKILSTKNIP